jgi:Spy/CpxP family protein refolding chaperone
MGKVLAAITVFGGLLFAQPPADGPKDGPKKAKSMLAAQRPWWDGDLSKNANLSEAQQNQILQIRKEFRPHMREVQGAVMKADAELAAAFNEEPVDQAKANDAINRLAAARAEATRTVSQFSLKLRTVLTAQQWQDMQRAHPWPDRPGGRRRGTATPTTNPSATTNQQK